MTRRRLGKEQQLADEPTKSVNVVSGAVGSVYLVHDNKTCVTTEKKCAALYSCFWLVGHHQQGVAHLFSGVTKLYRTQSAECGCGF